MNVSYISYPIVVVVGRGIGLVVKLVVNYPIIVWLYYRSGYY